MKDAKGYGSNPRGAHSIGVEQIGKGIRGGYMKSYTPEDTVALFAKGITPLDGRKVDAIAAAMRAGKTMPPITYDKQGYVADGMHRYAAMMELRRNPNG